MRQSTSGLLELPINQRPAGTDNLAPVNKRPAGTGNLAPDKQRLAGTDSHGLGGLLLQVDSEDTAKSPEAEQSESGVSADTYQQECTLLQVRNFNVACETNFRYPAYYVMCHSEELSVLLTQSESL